MSSPEPLDGLEHIAPYAGGESKLIGVDRIIKLGSNEGAFGPSKKVLKALESNAQEFFRYPDGDCNELRELIANKYNFAKQNIICGAGSDELISLICRSYAGPGDEILHSAHGFAMYPIYGRTVRATVVAAPEKNITVDVDKLLALITDKTKLLFIANPNNPTGTYIPRSEVQRLINLIPKRVLLVLDAAYSEFVDEYKDTYFKEVFEILSAKYKLGRVRILLKEPRSTLSWHRDPEPRLHIPIITNPGAIMVVDHVAKHMPADGSVWITNNTKYHNAFNGGEEDRIHLVACVLDYKFN